MALKETVIRVNGGHEGPDVVESPARLESLCRELAKEPRIGMDVEADSLFHYREKVCLLQIATSSRVCVVDPLALDSLAPLGPILADPDIVKIFHGADYDMRSLYRDFSFEVENLFDTQVAARFLGDRETGLAHQLHHRFGLTLEKKYQKKNWAKRPLPPEMLAYAATDAAHLLPLAEELKQALSQSQRLSWVEEECSLLAKVRPAPLEDNPLFFRFKGAGKLDPRSLAVLESLLRFRDEMARKLDRPPFKVLGGNMLMALATQKPKAPEELKASKILTPKLLRLYGSQIVKSVLKGLSVPEESLIPYPRRPPSHPARNTAKRTRALKEWRQEKAERMELDPSIILTNNQARTLALNNPRTIKELGPIEELRTWQKKAFGQEIIKLLK